MSSIPEMTLSDPRVAIAFTEPHYGSLRSPQPAPELPGGLAYTVAQQGLRALFRNWGLDSPGYGTPRWNPLADWIPAGARVLLKPNLVYHLNQSGGGIDCLVTHTSLIEAVVNYVALTKPTSIQIGDAPIQGCDFATLCRITGLDELLRKLQERSLPVALRDFRRTILRAGASGRQRFENQRSLEEYVLFDMGNDSLLEELREDSDKFRVTMYNPDLLHNTHGPNKHQYLVAREVIDADVVVNLPKLKSHKKSCVTGTLKNMIGMNGNKEFLPHHRKGGADSGGDCYAGGSRFKWIAESVLDHANKLPSGRGQQAWARMAEVALSCAVKLGDSDNLEGSWYGNDTIWRTCLDLQRLLHYGRPDGSIGPSVQRQVIHITDAIVGGDGEGPLAPDAVESGFLTGARNGAAAEWVHSLMMGFAPAKIPLIRHAFDSFRYPLTTFPTEQVVVLDGSAPVPVSELPPARHSFAPPKGWKGHCEREH